MEEPRLIKKNYKDILRQRKVLVMISLFVLIVLIAPSYALLSNFKKLDNAVNVTTANMNMSVTQSSSITLEGKLPESDTSGLENATPVSITVKNANTGPFTDTETTKFQNTSASTIKIVKYELKLVPDTNQPSTLDNQYIKYSVSTDNGTTYSSPKKVSESSTIIFTGYNLDLGQTKDIKLKIWIDENAGQNGINKNYYGAITVEMYQNIDIRNLPKSTAMNYIVNHDTIKFDNIRFYEISGTDNGNGLYLLPGTETYTYPIYYYRGNVDNNNVYFAENCWKIVRTTSTGGLKLVYNSSATDVDGEKQCLETSETGTSTITMKAFNSSYKSPAYVGYSLPESSKRYSYSTQTLNSTTYYGSSVDPTTYKLVDPVLELNDTHHYSYNSPDPNATGIEGDTGNVRYYYYKNSASGTSGTGYFIKFDKTKSVSTILDEMLTESNSKNNPSNIQGVINTWWGTGDNSLNSKYGEYLEDTEWCNDRSVASLGGWSPTGTLYSSNWYEWALIFNERVRYDQSKFGSDANNIKNTNTPILTCSNPNDRLTVANGNLTYPIGLLTYDEVALAGAILSNGNSNFYLYTNQYYWLLSPLNFFNTDANVGDVYSSGNLSGHSVNYPGGVRPALSLKHGTQILRGEGTKTKPYIITED